MQAQQINFLTDSVHTAVLNPQGSKTFVKKMIPVAVAFILHQRTTINRNNFATRAFNGVMYKTFREKVNSDCLKEVCDWVAGALDAIEKNYLREIYLIFGSRADPETVLESYKFQFKYMGANVLPLHEPPTKEQVAESTAKLLEGIRNLEQYRQLTEDQFVLRMGLTFYEAVTPLAYQPPFFGNDAVVQTIVKKVLAPPSYNLSLGRIGTGFHVVKCRAKADMFGMNESTLTDISDGFPEEPINAAADPTRKLDEDIVINLSEDEIQMEAVAIVEPEGGGIITKNTPVRFSFVKTNAAADLMELDEDMNIEIPKRGSQPEAQDIPEVTEDISGRKIAKSLSLLSSSSTTSHTSTDIICLDSDEKNDDPDLKIHCICRIGTKFDYIDLVECPKCFYQQHSACEGSSYKKDTYICQVCKYDEHMTPNESKHRQLIAALQLAVAYAYFTKKYPDDVIDKLPQEIGNKVVDRFKLFGIKIETDGRPHINVPVLENIYLEFTKIKWSEVH